MAENLSILATLSVTAYGVPDSPRGGAGCGHREQTERVIAAKIKKGEREQLPSPLWVQVLGWWFGAGVTA